MSYYLEILQLTYFLSWLHITKTTACKQPRWCLNKLFTPTLCAKTGTGLPTLQGVVHKWCHHFLGGRRGQNLTKQGQKGSRPKTPRWRLNEFKFKTIHWTRLDFWVTFFLKYILWVKDFFGFNFLLKLIKQYFGCQA